MAAQVSASSCKLRQPRDCSKPACRQSCRRILSRAWRNKELKHVVDSREFSRGCLDLVFTVAEQMEKVRPGSPESKQLEGYCMATLFYEPSTRTRLSFEAAMGKLGGVILSTESAGEFSSAAKGETLEGNALFLHIRCILPNATSPHRMFSVQYRPSCRYRPDCRGLRRLPCATPFFGWFCSSCCCCCPATNHQCR